MKKTKCIKIGNLDKRGFTLIELLAVIVILAVIALIATPIVLNIISDSQKSAALRSAENYVDAVNRFIVSSQLNNKQIANGEYSVNSNGNLCIGSSSSCANDEALKIEINGTKPENGSKIIIEKGKVVAKLSTDESKITSLTIGKYIIQYDNNGKLVILTSNKMKLLVLLQKH